MGRLAQSAEHATVRRTSKRCLDWCAIAAVAPLGWACALEARLGGQREEVFALCAQTLALVPGLPGAFFRRAFYRLTLDACGESVHVGFGAFFSHRRSIVEENVYVGPYSIVGTSRLRRGALIGSRVSIISGVKIHDLDAAGRRRATDSHALRVVEVGEDVWIGEGSLVMADIGRSSTVAAGSVVAHRVPPNIVVAGNPARFVRHVHPPAVSVTEEPASAAV
jgi:virginiamycin A acetyltransferase